MHLSSFGAQSTGVNFQESWDPSIPVVLLVSESLHPLFWIFPSVATELGAVPFVDRLPGYLSRRQRLGFLFLAAQPYILKNSCKRACESWSSQLFCSCFYQPPPWGAHQAMTQAEAEGWKQTLPGEALLESVLFLCCLTNQSVSNLTFPLMIEAYVRPSWSPPLPSR